MNNFLKEERGSALVEFSLILPVLVLVMLGTMDMALIARKAMLVNDAARAGAEYAIITGNSANYSGMQSAALQNAAELTNMTAAVTHYCACTSGGSSISCTSSCSSGVSPIEYVSVSTTASAPLLFGISGLPASIPLKSTSTIRVPWLDQ